MPVVEQIQANDGAETGLDDVYVNTINPPPVRFGFSGNGVQLTYHWILAVLIGLSLRMTTFPDAMIAAEMGVDNYTRETSFLVAFGFTKALSNLIVGWGSDRFGRRAPHIFGWIAGLVLAALLLTAAPASEENGRGWARYVIADAFLGVQQSLTWTTNVFCFMDILGPAHYALASGISNSTGYIASAIATYIAAALSIQSAFTVVLVCVALGLAISALLVKDTTHFAKREAAFRKDCNDIEMSEEANAPVRVVPRKGRETTGTDTTKHTTLRSGVALKYDLITLSDTSASPSPALVAAPSLQAVFAATCWHSKSTAVICFSGLITNLVTSLSWGLVLIWGRQQTISEFYLANIGSAFTFAKAFSQVICGHLSDHRHSRKLVLVIGFSVSVVGLALTAMAGAGDSSSLHFIYGCLLIGGIIIGCGIGSVYCVLTSAIADHTPPQTRASAIGVYKFWRDSGYAFGGLLTGWIADASGGNFIVTTIVVACLVAALTALIAVVYVEAHHPPCSAISQAITIRRMHGVGRNGKSRMISTEIGECDNK